MFTRWIHRVVRRDRKRITARLAKRRQQRRLLLQGLETRNLLSADMMSMSHDTMDSALVSQEHHDSSSMMHQHTTSTDSGQPHADNPALAAEHNAALALVDVSEATHTAVASGDWSDPSVWANSELPMDGAKIVIPQDVSITVDGIIEQSFYTIRIDGVLQFRNDVDTQLSVDTIVSSPGGRFEMGTRDAPIQADVTARVLVADTGSIDRDWDPRALSRGLVLHGTTVINGAAKNSWSTLQVAPRAGDLTITLAEQPDGWVVGDMIVIAGTNSDASGDEVRAISNIDGNVVTLNEPLEEDHIPPANDLQVHVANTTRNAVIESENPAIDRRGHVMFMHTRDVQVSHAGFYELGRTNKLEANDDSVLNEDGSLVPGTGTNPRGRYSVHFHINGTKKDTAPATLVGSAVVGSPGWGYVNHSSYVDMIDNVSYDVDGAAFNTEVGDEVGSFVNNLSIRTHGTGGEPNDGGDNQDFGTSGDGFWFHGSGISAVGNVASGATGSGIIFYGETLILGERDDDEEPLPGTNVSEYLVENLPDPSVLPGVTSIPTLHVPFHNVRDNTAYASRKGFEIYKHRIGDLTEDQQMRLGVGSGFFANNPLGLPDGEIDGVTVWNSQHGVKLSYTADTQFKNVRVINSAGQPGEIGFDATNVYNRGNHTYENFDIEGFETGLYPSRGQTVVIDGGRFANNIDIDIPEPRMTHRRLEIKGDVQFDDLDDGASGELASDRQNIVMEADMRNLVDGNVTWFLLSDRAILNFGDFDGQQIYYSDQLGDQVLFTEQPDQVVPDDPGIPVPEQFIGLTNQQLQEQYMTSFGGSIPPDDAVDSPEDGIVGLIGTATGDPALPDPTDENDVAVVPGVEGFEQEGEEDGEEIDEDDDEDLFDGDDEEDDHEFVEDDEDGDEPFDDEDGEEDEDEPDDDDEPFDDGDGEEDDEPFDDDDGEEDEGEPDDDDERFDDGDGEEDDEPFDDEDGEEDEDEPDDDESFDEQDDPDDVHEDTEFCDEDSGSEQDDHEMDSDRDVDDQEESEEDLDEDSDEFDDDESELDEDEPEVDDEFDDEFESEQEDDENIEFCDPSDESDDDSENHQMDDESDVDEPDDGLDEFDNEDESDFDEGDVEEDEDSDSEEQGDGVQDPDDDMEFDEFEADEEEFDFHNDDSPTDVNNDGLTSALDALAVINFLLTHGSDFLQLVSLALQHYVDVNNDRSASALDALQIINSLIEDAGPGEPESSATEVVFAESNPADDEEDEELIHLLSEAHHRT